MLNGRDSLIAGVNDREFLIPALIDLKLRLRPAKMMETVM